MSQLACWLSTLVSIFISTITVQAQGSTLPSLIPSPSASQSVWARMEKLFIFGDSWSSTGFDYKGVQPSPSAPLGNPVGNYTLVDVANKGARWPVYLTTTYNASLLETYSFAQPSSVVDDAITPHGGDFVKQVKTQFLPTYGNASSGNWSAGSTLFFVFFGVNDVNLVHDMTNSSRNGTLDRIFASYTNSVEQLYQAGARNFVLINEPPMDLAPAASPGLKVIVTDWNARLKRLIQSFGAKYHSNKPSTSMNIVEFDIHALFTSVIANPASIAQTAGIKNVTGWCDAYYNKGVRNGPEYFNASCGTGLKLGEYMWINQIHPTITMYQAIAAQIAKLFGA